jgi:outer membrane protein TolC
MVPIAASAQSSLTLAATVESALSRHPSVAAAEQALAAAQARLTQARAGRSIQAAVTAQSSYGNALSLPPGGPATAKNTGIVSASLDLVNLQARYQIDQAEAAVRSAEAALAGARQDAALSAATAYFSVLKAQAVVVAREAAAEASAAQVKQAEAQVRAGGAARADVLQAQAAQASTQVDLIAARNQVETALAQLRAAMGVSVTEPVAVTPSTAPAFGAMTREQAVSGAVERPEVKRAHADVAATQAALALTQVQARPILYVTGSSSVDTFKVVPDLIWSLAATVTYPVLDGGRAQAAIDEARANVAAAQFRESLVLQTAQADALTAWVALQDAQARLVASRVSEAAATEALRATEGRYRAGVGTILEVLTARTALEAASLTRIQAEFDGQSAVLRLRYVVGRPVVGGDQ